MLWWECIIQFLWWNWLWTFNVKMVHSVPCYILWLWCQLQSSFLGFPFPAHISRLCDPTGALRPATFGFGAGRLCFPPTPPPHPPFWFRPNDDSEKSEGHQNWRGQASKRIGQWHRERSKCGWTSLIFVVYSGHPSVFQPRTRILAFVVRTSLH